VVLREEQRQPIHRSGAAAQRFADLPMVSERIDNAPHTPTVWLVGDGRNGGASGSNGLLENGIRIIDDHDDPHSAAAQRLRAEIQVLRRLIGNPEFGFLHR